MEERVGERVEEGPVTEREREGDRERFDNLLLRKVQFRV